MDVSQFELYGRRDGRAAHVMDVSQFELYGRGDGRAAYNLPLRSQTRLLHKGHLQR